MAGEIPTANMLKALDAYSRDPARNKVEAYKAGYSWENMKPNVLAVRATELFNMPFMKNAVAAMNAAASARTGINKAWVLKRAALLADFNISKFIRTQDDGTAVYDFSNATDDDWYCISEYTVDTLSKRDAAGIYEVDRVKLKSHCKLRALELVGKHIDVGAFSDKVEHTGVVGLASLSMDEYKAARAEMLKEDDV